MYYENFTKLCETRGVTPNKVGTETGIASPTLVNWKKGKYTPKIDKLQRIADYFGVPLTAITGAEEPDSDLTTEEYAMLQQFRDDPNIRAMFRLSMDADKEQLDQALKVLKALWEK